MEEKPRIVAETHEPEATVGAVAARHDVYPSLQRTWCRQVREGCLVAAQARHFVPARLTAIVRTRLSCHRFAANAVRL